MSKDPFDFTDLTDLPEDLQKKLHRDTNDNAKEFAEVVAKGAAAGVTELDINQIMAAAMRMGIEVPTQQTVRDYLNKAVKLGLLTKPTRQTYAVGPKLGEVEEAEETPKKAPAKKKTAPKAAKAETKDEVVAEEPPADEEDPLAALGL